MLHRTLIAAPLLIAGVAGAQTPGVWFTGLAPNASGGWVTATSQDGRTSTGGCYGSVPQVPYAPGFTYTVAGGRYDWGLEPGMPAGTSPAGISSDGQVIVGSWRDTWEMGMRPFRRLGNGPIQDLGLPPGEERGFATGVSGSGGVIVGWGEHSQFTNAYGQAFRWTESGGMQGLGYTRPNGTLSIANGISRDGSTIVGFSESDGPGGDVEAFRWTQAGGMDSLPGLSGAPFISHEAEAVNADGSVVVGRGPSATPQGHNHAIRWLNGVPEDLGTVAGFSRSVAWAVDDSGAVIGGVTYTGQPTSAFVWTPSTGMVLLSDYLSEFGILTPAGYRLEEVYAISGDGRTFAGLARDSTTNIREGFVATIPAPTTPGALLLGVLLLSRHRRA